VTDAQDVVDAVPRQAPGEPAGWYLFGITRWSPALADALASLPELGLGSRSPQVLPVGDLAAVVTTVRLVDFAPDTLAARADDPVWLEQMVRGHNDVIAAVHERAPILPAKFGSVFARTDDLGAAIAPMSAALAAQLDRLEGADEWAVHIYADPSAAERRVAAEDPDIRALKDEVAQARPGRAYFLQRKIADLTAQSAEAELEDLAEEAFRLLAVHALDAEITPANRSNRNAEGWPEIVKAAYLVPRDGVSAFLQSVDGLSSHLDGVTAECSGPWPPYSFAGESLP
jgi:hypothetical protein